MTRQIKFKVWTGEELKPAFDLSSAPRYWWEDNKDYPLIEYIGRRDVNGKEIYEGFIVKIRPYKPGVVTYCEKRSAWKVVIIEGNIDVYFNQNSQCTVIGNVFENPIMVKL